MPPTARSGTRYRTRSYRTQLGSLGFTKRRAKGGNKEELRTPSFGSLRFPSCPRQATKWCCVSGEDWPVPEEDDDETGRRDERREKQDQQAKLIVDEILFSLWNLPPPRVIISVVGHGTRESCNLMPDGVHILRHFRQGLRGALRTTRGWLVTVGTDDGISSIVGQTIQEEMASTGPIDTVCLGIAPLQRLHLHEEIEASVKDRDGCFYDYQLKEAEKIKKPDRVGIEPNHTHM